MITEELSLWAQHRGHEVTGGIDQQEELVTRTVSGYLFSFGYEQNPTRSSAWAVVLGGAIGAALASSASKGYVIKVVLDHGSWSKPILKEINRELKKLGKATYAKGVLAFYAKKNTHTPEHYDRLDGAAETIADILTRNEARPQTECFYCHTTGCDTTVVTGKGLPYVYPAHTSCVGERAEEALEKYEQKQVSRSLFPALILLPVGLLVGALPAALFTLLEMYGSWLCIILFALVGICGFGLYQKANGPMKGGILLLGALLSLVVVTALVVWGDFLWINEEYLDVLWEEYVEFCLLDPEYLVGLGIEMFISYIATIVGVVIGWRGAKRKERLGDMHVMSLRTRVGR